MGAQTKKPLVVPKDKELLTVAEAVAVMEGTVSSTTIRAMIRSKELPVRRFRSRIIIARKDLLGVLA